MPPVLVSKGLRGRNPHEGEGKRSRVELHPGGGRHIDWAKKSLLYTLLSSAKTRRIRTNGMSLRLLSPSLPMSGNGVRRGMGRSSTEVFLLLLASRMHSILTGST